MMKMKMMTVIPITMTVQTCVMDFHKLILIFMIMMVMDWVMGYRMNFVQMMYRVIGFPIIMMKMITAIPMSMTVPVSVMVMPSLMNAVTAGEITAVVWMNAVYPMVTTAVVWMNAA